MRPAHILIEGPVTKYTCGEKQGQMNSTIEALGLLMEAQAPGAQSPPSWHWKLEKPVQGPAWVSQMGQE